LAILKNVNIKLAGRKINDGKDVPVKFEREPRNPVDARAIAIMCFLTIPGKK